MDFSWLPKCLHWPFCPGVFIAILAFVAAAVTFRKESGTREKAGWTFLFLALMCAEVWMMGIDRQMNEQQQKSASAAQLQGFTDVGNGIKAAITESDKNFNATIGKTNQVLLNVTGGDSYAYIAPQPGGEAIPLVVWNHGDQPLIGVTMTIARTQDPDWGASFFQPIFIGTIGPHDHAPVPRLIVPRLDEKSGQDHYWIMLSAQNGTVSQSLFFRKNRKNQSLWASSFQVSRPIYETKRINGVKTNTTTMRQLLNRGWTDEVPNAPH